MDRGFINESFYCIYGFSIVVCYWLRPGADGNRTECSDNEAEG